MSTTFAPILGEFIGTFFLVLLGDGVCAAVNLNKSKSQNSGWIVIAMGWGLAVTIAAYIGGLLGPAHLNPAVTLAMVFAGNSSWADLIPFIIAQFLGAIAGATAVYFHYLPHWAETKDQGAILGTFATGPAIRHTLGNFISECLGTFVLVFALLAFGDAQFADGITPLVVGGLIISIGLSLGGPTGYAINPARDLGPRLAHAFLPIPNKGDSDWGYAWIPVLAPLTGGLIAALLYGIIM